MCTVVNTTTATLSTSGRNIWACFYACLYLHRFLSTERRVVCACFYACLYFHQFPPNLSFQFRKTMRKRFLYFANTVCALDLHRILIAMRENSWLHRCSRSQPHPQSRREGRREHNGGDSDRGLAWCRKQKVATTRYFEAPCHRWGTRTQLYNKAKT